MMHIRFLTKAGDFPIIKLKSRKTGERQRSGKPGCFTPYIFSVGPGEEKRMSRKIITISREFGSGGRTIGRMAAEKLGIPCYDQELIDKIAEESGLVKAYVEENSENVTGGWLSFTAGRDIYGHSLQDDLNRAQSKVIREVAEQGPCVIIGRCADYILDDRDDLLKVFIHASMEKRAERIVNQYGEAAEGPVQRLKEKDKKRKAYYQLYTDRKWGDVANYHITLDSGVLGLETCAEIIAKLAE